MDVSDWESRPPTAAATRSAFSFVNSDGEIRSAPQGLSEMIIAERNQELAQIETDIHFMAETMQSTAELVSEQSKDLSKITVNLEEAESEVQESLKALDEANAHKAKARSRFWTAVGVGLGMVIAGVGTALTLKSVGPR
jgi:t-SNARE complex subunit (syntaxin)